MAPKPIVPGPTLITSSPDVPLIVSVSLPPPLGNENVFMLSNPLVIGTPVPAMPSKLPTPVIEKATSLVYAEKSRTSVPPSPSAAPERVALSSNVKVSAPAPPVKFSI